MFDRVERNDDENAPAFEHARLLDILARADSDRLTALAGRLLPGLDAVEVV